MTDEELEKEVEKLIQRFEMANSMNCFMQLTPDRKQIGEMLVMIAEPREKRIEELKKICQDLSDKFDFQVKQVVKLENENVDLKRGLSVCNASNSFNKKQLTKAKEIIFTLLDNFAYPIEREDWTVEDVEIVDKAEQFLKEADE